MVGEKQIKGLWPPLYQSIGTTGAATAGTF